MTPNINQREIYTEICQRREIQFRNFMIISNIFYLSYYPKHDNKPFASNFKFSLIPVDEYFTISLTNKQKIGLTSYCSIHSLYDRDTSMFYRQTLMHSFISQIH